MGKALWPVVAKSSSDPSSQTGRFIPERATGTHFTGYGGGGGGDPQNRAGRFGER
jgi:hypothetical protein